MGDRDGVGRGLLSCQIGFCDCVAWYLLGGGQGGGGEQTSGGQDGGVQTDEGGPELVGCAGDGAGGGDTDRAAGLSAG